MNSKKSRDIIEITVRNSSPWKGVMADALEAYLVRWGWDMRRVKNGDFETFIGTERAK